MSTMLRRLKETDVRAMLEWMHDEDVARNFRFDFLSMTEDRALNFIRNSFTDENRHFAIVDAADNYLGTISLKNISPTDRNAEFAIVLSKKHWGGGYSRRAVEELLDYAFNTLHLHRVYLNVLTENIRANKFYQKCGFVFEGCFKDHLCGTAGDYKDLNWYAAINEHESY